MQAIKLNRAAITFIPAILLGFAGVAGAHPGHNTGTGLSAGLAHPLSGVDHILAMIAVGLLAAQIGGRALWILPITFVALMCGGGLLNRAGIGVPMVEQMIVASVIVLGLLIAFASRMPVIVSTALVGVFAIFHGYAHVAEMSAQSPVLYALGFVAATSMLHIVGIALGLGARRYASAVAIRYSGAAIALGGILLLAHVI